jgi:hypothetical protein
MLTTDESKAMNTSEYSSHLPVDTASHPTSGAVSISNRIVWLLSLVPDMNSGM